MSQGQSIAAISEDGAFHLWDVDNGSETIYEMKIVIPEDRVCHAFFNSYIVGFVTQKGYIYLANYGSNYPKPKNCLDLFCKIDWTEQVPFLVKDVIWWRNGKYAFVLSESDSLYEVGIDHNYNVKDEPQHIQPFVKKVLLSPSNFYLDIQNIYLLTYDGRIIKYNLVSKKKQVLSFGKVSVDFSVTKIGNKDKIESIDEKGEIQQHIL